VRALDIPKMQRANLPMPHDAPLHISLAAERKI
jgi:hypothetical protein